MDRYDVNRAMQILQDHIHKRYEVHQHPEPWCNLPEIPGKAEIMPQADFDRRHTREEWNEYMNDPIYSASLPHNIVHGPWPNKMEYLGAHYQILREDAIAPLRKSVDYFRQHQDMLDNDDTYVYSSVHVKGLKLGALGVAFRVTFSTEGSGKRIRWDNSKRLQQGTMVALSPERDMFGSICKVAIVAARPMSGLEQDPAEVDLFWGEVKDAVIDPSEAYVMLEARIGYFEASRHMLVAFQKLVHERFQLSRHIVELDNDIQPPRSVEGNPLMDLNSLSRSQTNTTGLNDAEALNNVDVLNAFPRTIPNCSMDNSQITAFKRMLTKSLAIVQGPPGTGKTFTSVSALRALIENAPPGSPPVIIAAQTNQALDQLLNHVLDFEPAILRLGGRSAFENTIIRTRTLYKLRMVYGMNVPDSSKGLQHAKRVLEVEKDALKSALFHLLTEKLLTDDILRQHDMITESQRESLYETGWVSAELPATVDGGKATKISEWLTGGQLMRVPCTPQINFGLEIEEFDEDLQQLPEEEPELKEGFKIDDVEMDSLFGEEVLFQRKWTGISSAAMETRRIEKMLKKYTSLYDIPVGYRGAIYRYWEKQLDRRASEQVVEILQRYNKVAGNSKVTRWISNIRLINHVGIKVIGCTTTGLSKYRGLLSALQPHTLLIEEAAETLEGTVIAGMFDSVDRLILVGDHKQLQANCNVRALSVEPYYLNTSMFERLVNNGISYTMLNVQRRMISDVRKLLSIEPKPFYHGLQDHSSVLDRRTNRPPVPGMGGRDVYFFNHNWPETRNSDFSMVNHDEAEMIAGFFNYLHMNGTSINKITVLSFYTGQKKRILSELKKNESLRGNRFNVHTVDSFQGEENDIILLSLVRSNMQFGVGFLSNQNRLVVALSRARRGLYIFGNAITLCAGEGSSEEYGVGRDLLWSPLIHHMGASNQLGLDGGLPITCKKHGTTTIMNEANDWHRVSGGCELKCGGKLPCGHGCPYFCHDFPHEDVVCKAPCPRSVPLCGHGCSKTCGEVCHCFICRVPEPTMHQYTPEEAEAKELKQPLPSSRRGFEPRIEYDRRSQSGSNASLYDASPKKPGRRVGSQDIRNIPSTPSRHSTVPGNNPFARRNQDPNQSPGTTEKWNSWDAKKADIAVEKAYRVPNAAIPPMMDHSKLVFEETYRQTTVKDGVRIKTGAAIYNTVAPGLEGRVPVNRVAYAQRPASVVESQPRPRVQYPQAKLTPIDSVQSSIMAGRSLYSGVKLGALPGITYTNCMIQPASKVPTLVARTPANGDGDPFDLEFSSLALASGRAAAHPTASDTMGDLISLDADINTRGFGVEEPRATENSTLVEEDLLIDF